MFVRLFLLRALLFNSLSSCRLSPPTLADLCHMAHAQLVCDIALIFVVKEISLSTRELLCLTIIRLESDIAHIAVT